jgi:peptide/nickel transport system permease protein
VFYLFSEPLLADPNIWLLALLLAIAIGVAIGVGMAVGGLQRRQARASASLAAFLTSGVIFSDYMLQSYASFATKVRGRPISTIGSQTPNFRGNFWEVGLDSGGHLLLPTLALLLISFAVYTRYTRSSMLEVMNQDYMRTARAKGLTERTVVMRHGFRNALIPVTTLMAFDFGAVIGGAVITESVFGWQGMGYMFITGLREVDPNPVMAFFLVVGGSIVSSTCSPTSRTPTSTHASACPDGGDSMTKDAKRSKDSHPIRGFIRRRWMTCIGRQTGRCPTPACATRPRA